MQAVRQEDQTITDIQIFNEINVYATEGAIAGDEPIRQKQKLDYQETDILGW